MINRLDYPFIDMILWDNNKQYISDEELFYYIEKRWRYIDTKYLTDKEHTLIHNLTMRYGNGMLLV